MEELMEKNTEEEVTEEEVQAVANAIVEEANETDATVEEVINPIIEEDKEKHDKEVTNKNKKPKSNKKIDFEGRGFASLKDAENFVNTETFAKLGKEDQEEYLNWLNK